MTVVVAILSMACRTPENGRDAHPRPERLGLGWVVAEENDSLRIAIDTSRIVHADSTVTLWIAVSTVRGPDRHESSSAFKRFEFQDELMCAAGIARGLNRRTPDSAGRFFNTPVRDSSWTCFECAGVLQPILVSACGALARLSRLGR